MGKTYIMGTGVKTQKFICIENCEYQDGMYSTKYLFKKGEVYEYAYQKRKMATAIYRTDVKEGKYNGSVRYTFVDRYFLPENDHSTLEEIDKWFDSFLHSNVKIKRIKKI